MDRLETKPNEILNHKDKLFTQTKKLEKLNPFIENEIEKEPILPKSLENSNSQTEKFSESMDIENFANSSQFLENLVYLKNEKTKENKISFENIINLKKKAETPFAKPKTLQPYYQPKDNSDATLIFESRFESGNLLCASKRSENEYILILQNDTNTVGYNQWFFFRVSNVRENQKVKINIINQVNYSMTKNKKYSLYNKGMRVLVYSEKKAEKQKIGWHRSCTEIDYFRNGLYKSYKDKKTYLSSLVFNYTFEFNDDTVFFANTVPYTYTELYKELNEFEKDEKKYYYLTRKSLCTTLGGNNVDIITIAANERNEDISGRPGIVIMARVHPGETVGSWMMKGVIDFLTSNAEDAVFLRKNYVIKLVPMMNPDGVITGNYRTSFAGCDLNRRWENPSEALHPEIFAMKNLILKFSKTREIALICDLHGHSGLHNVFMYGNRIKEEPLACKVFPFIMSRINKSFHFGNCAFKLQKFKFGCARINLFHELNIANIFTMEASFSGCKFGEYELSHFSTSMLKEIGRDLCKAIILYQNSANLFQEKLEAFLSEKKEKIVGINSGNSNLKNKNNLSQNNSTFVEDKENLKNGVETALINECEEGGKDANESDGSDSEPSVDNLEKEELLKLLPNHAKKKRKNKKKKAVTVVKLSKKKEEEKIEIKENSKPNNKNINKSQVFTTNRDISNSTANPVITSEKKTEKLIVNLKQVVTNRSFEKEKIIIDPRRKDQETQTEEIFFKMHWTYFKAKNYKIITPINTKYEINKRIAVSMDRDKKLYSFYNNVQYSTELKRSNMGNMYYVKKESNSTNRNIIYGSNIYKNTNSQRLTNLNNANIMKSPLHTILERNLKKR